MLAFEFKQWQDKMEYNPKCLLHPDFCWAMAVLVVGGMVIEPVEAQTYTGPTERHEQIESSDRVAGGTADLPSWAEPSEGTSQFDGQRNTGNPSAKAVPPPPENPNNVPVDGGLLWLILAGGGLAGGGYATWKLGSEERTSSLFGGMPPFSL